MAVAVAAAARILVTLTLLGQQVAVVVARCLLGPVEA
jgi:hypothetical protein